MVDWSDKEDDMIILQQKQSTMGVCSYKKMFWKYAANL